MCAKGYDQKNLRRRVYDALNVLMAMNIISREKKEVQPAISFSSRAVILCCIRSNGLGFLPTLNANAKSSQKKFNSKRRELHSDASTSTTLFCNRLRSSDSLRVTENAKKKGM